MPYIVRRWIFKAWMLNRRLFRFSFLLSVYPVWNQVCTMNGMPTCIFYTKSTFSERILLQLISSKYLNAPRFEEVLIYVCQH